MMVLVVTETATVALTMAVFIALVTASTRLLRTSEEMYGAAVFLSLSFLCLCALVAIVRLVVISAGFDKLG